MATTGLAVTFNDLRQRLNPNGQVDFVMEVLAQSNAFMDRMVWMEGNLPTGNLTTQRTSVAQAELRRINAGVGIVKTTTEQITDTCCILEARSRVDVELLALQPDKEAFCRSEDAGILMGISNQIAGYFFYGDSTKNSKEFNGLAMRYNTLKGSADKTKPGHQVVSAGGSGSTNTSVWFVNLHDKGVVGIYPKGSQAGIKVRDLGERTVRDADDKEYQALETLFTVKPGLAVRDIRAASRLCNIDVTTLMTLDSDAKRDLITKLVYTKNKLRNMDNTVMVVGDDMYSFLEAYLLDKNNVHVTRQDVGQGGPLLYFGSAPVIKDDNIRTDEAKVS